MELKISIIVPVYNTSLYLHECLSSLVEQTLDDIEIIVVNDGSTDNSMDVINHYSDKDPRIKVISHDNIGLGPSRNKAISVAKGMYIAFVDSDDYVDRRMFQSMYDLGYNTNSDIIVCDFRYVYENSISINPIRIEKDLIELEQLRPDVFFRDYYFSLKMKTACWNKIYRRSMLEKNNILFEDNKKVFSEDNLFNLMCFMTNPKIALMEEAFYFYRAREGSLMNMYKKEYLRRELQLISTFQKYLQDSLFSHSDSVVANIEGTLFLQALLGSAINEYSKGGGAKFSCLLEQVRVTLSQPNTKKYINSLLKKGGRNYITGRTKKLYTLILITSLKWKLGRIASLLLWLRVRALR